MITTKVLATSLGYTRSRLPSDTQPGGRPQQQQQTQQRERRTGQCSICLRVLSLNVAGVIHQHGPCSTPCAGTGCPPIEGSVSCKQAVSSEITTTAIATGNHQEDLIDIIRAERCRLLKRIPKASRALAADKLATVLARIIAKSDDTTAWSDLLRFSYACFAVPGGRAGKRHHQCLTAKVNNSLNAYPNISQRSQSNRQPSRRRFGNAYNIAARISEKLEDGNVRGAIRLAASDDAMAPHDDKTLAALLLKHPPRRVAPSVAAPTTQNNNSLNSPSSLTPPPLVVLDRDILDAIKSFPAGSAGGIDGMRPQHLKDLTSVHTGDAGQRLISRLTEFANLCLAGDVPTVIRPVFCGASLCALTKKDGGIRPIAVGCTLRRLVAKTASKSVQAKMATKLAPIQLGFGVKQGTEAAAHAARRFLWDMQPGQALLKLDFVNAFNAISREEILRTLREELPELYPFISTCYSSSSHLCFDEFLITSDEGAQQGDPLGPLLFCAAAQKLARLMKSTLNIWYMDDGSLGDEVDVLIEDFEVVRRIGSAIGLLLNEHKCELVTDDMEVVEKFRAIAPSINHVSTSHADMLGAPIGSLEEIDIVLTKKISDFQRLACRLKQLCAHDAFYLLKNCFSLPKLQYILRCAPCYSSQVLLNYDNVIRDTLQSILNVSLTESIWQQATLPVRNGGIGVRLATQVALPSFLSSVASSSELVLQLLPPRLHSSAGLNDQLFTAAVVSWKQHTGQDQPPEFIVTQKAWDIPLIEVAVERVLSAAPNQAGLARLIAAAAPHSGAFLQTLPCSAVGTRLDDASLRIGVALRLGAPVCAPHKCICGVDVDSSGVHGLSCRKSAGRHVRHSTLNDLVKRALASAEVPSRLEPTSLSRSDGKRPDGLTMMPWKYGRCMVWDVTCPDTLAPSHLDRAVTGPSAVATFAEDNKRLKYAEISRTHVFIPIAVETMGAVGKDGLSFLKELGTRIMTVTQERRSFEFLMQRISVAIQRGNAACILGTLPSASELDDIFYL